MKAFPKIREHQDESGQDGMDLRDYFAAKAMPVIFEKSLGGKPVIVDFIRYEIAKEAYLMADAMMKAREQK